MSEETVSKLKQDLVNLKEHLKQERDEIRLQLHLLKKEAKGEWDGFEQNWEVFVNKVDQTVKEFSDEVAITAKDVGEKLKSGYENIKRDWKDN